MLKNKKSEGTTLIPAALVRIVVSVLIILLIIFPFLDKLHDLIIGSDKKYEESFKNFLDGVDRMNVGRAEFEIELKPKSAIVGFSRNADKFECFNCYECLNCYKGAEERPTIIFNKPNNQECKDSACICLCSNGFQLVEGSLEGKSTKFVQCPQPKCKNLDKQDIPSKMIVKYSAGINIVVTTVGQGAVYWKNGFLFANGVPWANGIYAKDEEERTQLIVEKRSNLIGVCNPDIMRTNQNDLKFDTCIITEYDEAKKLEQSDMQKAIQKYKDFAAKYKTGSEVGESLFKIGKYYFDQGNYLDSAGILCQLVKNFPTSSYRAEASGILSKIGKNTAGIDTCS